MSRKDILIIAGLTFLAFANSLFNDFTGDAYSLFVENHFYQDLNNIPKVFTNKLVMGPADLTSGFVTHLPTDYTGFVSYRPVTALSFFMDNAIWKDNPFGYHLTNLLLHVITAVLVYILTLTVSKTANVALLAGILFGMHPIQAEVVNSIGYRSDSLVVLFYLSTILIYRLSRTSWGANRKTVYLWLSALCFFLALFSKESAMTLPVILLFYDYWFIARMPLSNFLQRRWKIYMAYGIIFFSYLFIYFTVIPSVFYSQYRLLGENFIAQAKLIADILFRYLVVLFSPGAVTVLPPLYVPAVGSIPSWHILLVVLFIAVTIGWAVSQFQKNRTNAFGVLWFFIAYLPTANVMSLLNPFAFRFMYLPSIGFFLVAAHGIDRFLNFVRARSSRKLNLEWIFKITFIGTALTLTLPLNFFFRNNIIACEEMIRVYPESSRPYWLLGLMYFKNGEYDLALRHLREYLDRPANLPFIPDPKKDYAVYHLMGRCYVDDPDSAIKMFYKVIELNPKFALVYADLAKAYILKEDFNDALNASLKAIAFQEDLVPGYVYAIHSYMALGDVSSAKTLLTKAVGLAPQDDNLRYLKGMIERYELQHN